MVVYTVHVMFFVEKVGFEPRTSQREPPRWERASSRSRRKPAGPWNLNLKCLQLILKSRFVQLVTIPLGYFSTAQGETSPNRQWCGAAGNRTRNLQFTILLLYQLSYVGTKPTVYDTTAPCLPAGRYQLPARLGRELCRHR